MSGLPPSFVELVETGPLVHLSTTNADGSPQVTVIWAGLDGDQLVTGHMSHQRKHRNIERDARVVLSFLAPRDKDAFLQPYAIVRAHAEVEPSDGAWDLLDRLAKIYWGTDKTFPAPRGPGFIVRYTIERIGGVGPWA